MPEAKRFLNRIRAGIRPESTSLRRFITEETFILGKPYSFKGHEFQEYVTELIEKDPNIDISVEKCSQIGLSEVFFRIVMGQMALTPGYSVGYLMPSVSFSTEVLKTRFSPLIDQSPFLSSLINKNVDSGSVKMFNNGSMLYALGANPNSKTTLINRPITLAVSDELDKLDYDTHTGLRSRQTHSKFKPRYSLSTPTFPGVGINAEAIGRQIHEQVVICHSCKHTYIPDYFTQVRLPGFDDPIETLTSGKINSLGLDTDKAYHFCPKCEIVSDLSPSNRAWEITDANLRKIHVKLTPFDAPSFISVPDLVVSQLTFSSMGEFRNQALGLTTELKDATVDVAKIEFTNDDAPSGVRISGIDYGRTCHYMSGVINQELIFVDTYKLFGVETAETDITNEIRNTGSCSVVGDAQPFLDLTHKLTVKIPYYWPAIYKVPVNPEPEMYKLRSNDAERVRQVNIQKNLVMDTVAGMLMSGQIVFRHSEYDDVLLKHFQSMRRIRDYRYTDIRYVWVKAAVAKGSGKSHDHFWHTLIYLVCASLMVGQAKSNLIKLPMSAMLRTFKNKGSV